MIVVNKYRWYRQYLIITHLQIDFAEFVMLMTEGDKETMKNKNPDHDSEKDKRVRQREEEICDLFYLFDRDRSGQYHLMSWQK